MYNIGIGIGIGKLIADISVIGILVNFLIGASTLLYSSHNIREYRSIVATIMDHQA